MYYTRLASTESEPARIASARSVIRADHNEPQTQYKTAAKKPTTSTARSRRRARTPATSKDNDAAQWLRRWCAGRPRPDLADGQRRRRQRVVDAGFQGSRVLRFGDKNVNTMGDEVVATDAETGTQLWSFKLARRHQAGRLPRHCAARGRQAVLLGTLEGKVLKLDPEEGHAGWRRTRSVRRAHQPVVDGGWIYVGTEDGKLVAINTGDPTITGWPTWGGNAQRTGVAHDSRAT